MGKVILYFSILLAIVLENSIQEVNAQSCNSGQQELFRDITGNPITSICVNNSTTYKLVIVKEWVDSWDEYGYNTKYYGFQEITVKRPDGTTKIVLDGSNVPYANDGISSEVEYIFPVGFFDQVGNWTLNYYSLDFCSGTPGGGTVILKAVGASGNEILGNEAICSSGGTPTNITNVSATANSSFTYRWQNRVLSGSWTDIAGNSATYQPAYINQSTTYRRFITTDELSCSSSSNEITKSVYGALTGGSIGNAENLCYNTIPSNLTETVAPTGGSSNPNYSYQWYISNDNTSWSAISGATGKTYQPSFYIGSKYYKRKAIDASCGEAYSNSILKYGYSQLQPGSVGTDQLICYGTTPTQLTVSTTESGGNGSFTYHWYSSMDNSNWSSISGATSATYQPSSLTAKTYFRKTVISSCGNLNTNVVTVDVRPQFNSGTIGNDQTICYNTTPSQIGSLVLPSGASNSYTLQWQSSLNNSTFTDITDATLSSYQPGNLTVPSYYRKKVTDVNCGSIYTNTVTVSVRPAFSPGAISADQTICYNTAPSLLNSSTNPSGGSSSYSYQWEYTLNGADWLNVSGATSATYQPLALTQSIQYRRQVTDASCGSGYTNTVAITVKPNFNVGTAGVDQTICYDAAPSQLHTVVAATGGMGSYSYYWEYSTNGADWSSISGANAETFQPGNLTATTYYRRKVTDASCGNAFNPSITVTVRSPFVAGSISADQTICYNTAPASLTTQVLPSGGAGSFTYTWESSSNGTDWNNITGATSASYQPLALVEKTYFRKKVTDVCGGGYTLPVTIQVRPDVSFGSIGSSQTICYNSAPGILSTDVAPSGGYSSFSYQWETSANNSTWSTLIGATGEGYLTGNLVTSTYYRRKVTDYCKSGYSNSILVTVRPTIVAGEVKNSQTICFNSSPNLLETKTFPSGGTGSFTFQWQSSTDNSAWFNVSGANTETYQAPALTSSIYYRRLETSGSCGTVNTNALHIVVNGQLTAGTIKSDQTICYGTSPSIFLTNTYPTGGTGAYSYQWQKLIGSSWTDISGANEETYTPSSLTANAYFRRAETSGSCGTVYSNQIAITVYAQFLPGVIGSSQTVNYNSVPSEFTSLQSASGANSSFTYQWKNSLDNSTWSNISGATAENYQAPALTAKTYYKRSTTSSTCGTLESNVITVNVNAQLVAGEVSLSQQVCNGSTPNSFSTTTMPSGGTGSYTLQWQKTEDGSNWSDVIGANSYSYQAGSLSKTTYFRKKVVSGSAIEYTNIITITVLDPFNAGTIAADQTVCYNSAPNPISAASLPSGGNGSFTNQWKYSLNGSTWYYIIGATDTYYEPAGLTSKTYYKKVVNNLCGVKETNMVTITVNPVFTPGSIGSNQTILFNTIPMKLDVSTTPTGGTGSYTYQWQSSQDNSIWTNISGATLESYQPGSTAQTNYFKRLTTSGTCGTIATNTVTITVTTEVLVGTIGNDQTVCYLAVPNLLTTLIQPSQGVVINSQVWQKSEDGITWSDILAATSDSYQPGSLAIKTHYRKRVVTATNGTIYTNIITVTVSPAFDPGYISSDQFVCKNYPSNPITTTVQPLGTSIVNQWQESDNNASWTDISGATNDYYDAGILTGSKYFRKKVTSACGAGYTNSVKVTVNEELQPGSIGNDQAIANNTAPQLLIGSVPSGGSEVYAYQWYYSLNNTDWQIAISGGNGKDYQPSTLTQKTYFKRSVTSGSCGVKYSNVLTVSVFDGLIPGTIGEAQSVCYNSAPALLTGTSPSGGNGQFSYQWQISTDGTSWSSITEEVGISYQPGKLTANSYFRRATISGNSSVNSNYIMIRVYDQITTPSTNIKVNFCKNARVNLDVVNPAYLSYKWYDENKNYLLDGTRYTVDNLTQSRTVFVRSVSSNGCMSDYLNQTITLDDVKAAFTYDVAQVSVGNSVRFTNTSVNASSFVWNFYDGDLIYEKNPTHYYNSLGELGEKKFDVRLKVTSPTGCVDSLAVANAITVVKTVTRVDTQTSSSISVFPNPVSDRLTVSSSERIHTVKVFSVIGKLIDRRITDSESVTLEFSSLKSGVYIIEVTDGKGVKRNLKVLKQ